MNREIWLACGFSLLIGDFALGTEANVLSVDIYSEIENRILAVCAGSEGQSKTNVEANIEEINRILNLSDDALVAKASCFEQLGNFDEAIAVYDEALRCFPDGKRDCWRTPVLMITGGPTVSAGGVSARQVEEHLRKYPDFTCDLALLGKARCHEKNGDVADAERTLLMVLEGRTAKEWKQEDKKYAESFVKFCCFRPATIAGLRLYALYKQNKKWKEALRLVDQYGVPCDSEELKQLRGMANGK